ncbi:MAG: hypothetical protein IJW87_00070 [Clostridia bacterium]|nr:hypothetical protein [Clostridia bacterium]
MKFREFWQKYKSDFFKLLTTRLALAVFSIVCTSPLLVMDTQGKEQSVNTIIILATIFVFAFYYYLIHSQLWARGAKDKIAADGGRLKMNRLTGLYVGLLASAPSFLLNLINIVTWFYKDYAGVRGVHTATALLELIWDAPALGIFYVSQSPLSYLLASVLPALFAGFSYYLGTKEFKLFGKKNESA